MHFYETQYSKIYHRQEPFLAKKNFNSRFLSKKIFLKNIIKFQWHLSIRTSFFITLNTYFKVKF